MAMKEVTQNLTDWIVSDTHSIEVKWPENGRSDGKMHIAVGPIIASRGSYHLMASVVATNFIPDQKGGFIPQAELLHFTSLNGMRILIDALTEAEAKWKELDDRRKTMNEASSDNKTV